ncbi:MAG: sugar ABC transporter substrate-binding protein [Hyphomicrobiales bacterium]|nr:sugar ABC transporter substrate-binding protein [Hyphomicrobiales bacterium]
MLNRRHVLAAGAALGLGIRPAQAQSTELNVWVVESLPRPNMALWEQFLAEFTSRTGHKVKAQYIAHGQMQQRLFVALSSGTGPDVLMTDNGFIPGFAEAGLLLDLTDRVKATDYLPAVLPGGAYGGRQYAVPVYVNNQMLFVNHTLLNEARVSRAPETWEELKQTAVAMRALGQDRFGLSLGSSIWGASQWYNFIWQNDGEIVDLQSKVRFNEPAAVESLEFLGGLVTKERVCPPSVLTARSWDEVHAPFVQGRAGMMLSGDWAIGTILSGAPQLDWTTVVLPRGRKSATAVGCYMTAINKDTKTPDAAFAFVSWLTTGDRCVEMLRAVSRISASARSLAPEHLEKLDPRVRTSLLQAQSGHWRPPVTSWVQIDQLLATAWDKVIRSEMPAKAALDEAAKAAEPLLRRA